MRASSRDRGFIKLGGKLVARDIRRAVAFSVEQHFAARDGCLRRFRACRPRRAEAEGVRSRRAIRRHDARVWPGRPAIRSILMFVEARRAQQRQFRARRSPRCACGRCAPIRAATKDCTPRLTRLMPARAQAAARSLCDRAGRDFDGRFLPVPAAWNRRPAGIKKGLDRDRCGAMPLGVPPPR